MNIDTSDGSCGVDPSSTSKCGAVNSASINEAAAQIQWSDVYNLEALPEVDFDDFDQICRTCLSRTSDLTSLFSFSSSTCPATIYQMLQTCLSYRVRKKDALLPQKICSSCISEVTRSYTFRERSRTVHDKLSRVLCIAEKANTLNCEPVKELDSVTAELQHDDYTCDEDSKDEDYKLSDNDLNDPDDEDVDHNDFSAGNDGQDVLLEEDSRKTVTGDYDEDMPLVLRRRRVVKRKKSSVKRTRAKLVISWKCRECDCFFDYRSDMTTHLRTAKHDPSHRFECQDCLKQMPMGKLKQHERSHTKERPFLCKICGKAFTMSCNLKRHMMSHTGERPHVCDLCGKGFIQLTSLNAHRRVHTNARRAFVSLSSKGGPVFNCTQCGRGFKSSWRYEFHLKNHHERAERRNLPHISLPPLAPPVEAKDGDSNVDPTAGPGQEGIPSTDNARFVQEEKYPCSVCGRTYKNKLYLKSHMLTHGEKKFLCSECGKGFVTKAALQSHLRVHTGERPHKCTTCGKSFAHVGSFESHVLTHTGEKPYSCYFCDKAFLQSSHLNRHLIVHSGETPHSCNICSKSFKQLSHLKYHLRIHSGEKPYECSYCGKTFALKGNLTVHVRTHTGETPHICLECGKGFYDTSSLKKHQRSHSSENDVSHRNRQQIGDITASKTCTNVENDDNNDMSEHLIQYQQAPHAYSIEDQLPVAEQPVFDLKYSIAQR